MKKIISFLPAFALVLSFSILHSCSSTAQQSNTTGGPSVDVVIPPANASGFHDVDVAGFKKMMDENPDAVLLDVRTAREALQSNIEGFTLIDISKPDFPEKIKALDKDKTYLIYCRSGRRSAAACQMMQQEGFTDLYNLKGGIIAWNKAQ